MASLHVRNVDGDIVMRLKRRAAAHGRSAEAEHRALLEETLRAKPKPSFEELAARLREKLAGRNHTPSEQLLRQSRDER
jgi:plasmid stability protein